MTDRDYRTVKLGRPFGDEDSKRNVMAVRVSDRLMVALKRRRREGESWQRAGRRILSRTILTPHGER
jgi:hypothetical protein